LGEDTIGPSPNYRRRNAAKLWQEIKEGFPTLERGKEGYLEEGEERRSDSGTRAGKRGSLMLALGFPQVGRKDSRAGRLGKASVALTKGVGRLVSRARGKNGWFSVPGRKKRQESEHTKDRGGSLTIVCRAHCFRQKRGEIRGLLAIVDLGFPLI